MGNPVPVDPKRLGKHRLDYAELLRKRLQKSIQEVRDAPEVFLMPEIPEVSHLGKRKQECKYLAKAKRKSPSIDISKTALNYNIQSDVSEKVKLTLYLIL